MKKLFLQLVAEFKRLGCKIVYANFNKIVICSTKNNVEDAIANIKFVVASIRNKELFHSLEITFSDCWKQLVWLDTANHGGIQAELPDNIQNDSEQIDPEANEDGDQDEEKEVPSASSVFKYVPLPILICRRWW